jgi:hypothetical protein
MTSSVILTAGNVILELCAKRVEFITKYKSRRRTLLVRPVIFLLAVLLSKLGTITRTRSSLRLTARRAEEVFLSFH